MADRNTNPPPQQPGAFARQQSPQDVEAMLAAPLPATRADILISPQLYLGRTVYVAKDPASLNYFRLQPAENFIFGQLDGRTSANDMAKRVNERFPNQQTTPTEVLQFVHTLQGSGLLLGRNENHAAWLRSLAQRRKQRMTRAKWFNFLFIKIPLIDPDKILGWMHGYVGPLMNRWTMWLSIVFIFVSAAAALFEIQRTASLAFPILGAQNLLLLSATFLTVKVIHEFGHGLAAKHRGLEVHEMGVLLMVFLPLYYVDTSDAWMVPRRSDRLWINAGGVFIEFLLAGVAVWIWLNTGPGVVNQIAFNIMLAASVTTVLFNANPLLRYDGYYFLMDWLQIPNMRAKASQYLGYLAKRYVLAMRGQRAPREAATHPFFMPFYAVAAGLYRWFVIFGIIALIYHILDPYGLEIIGSLLGAFAIVTMILMPAFKLVHFVWKQQAKTWRRALATTVGLAALAGFATAILAIPTEDTVEQPGVILAEQRQPLFAKAGGRIAEVFVQSGGHIEADQPIMRLETTKLENELELLNINLEQYRLNHEFSRTSKQPYQLEASTMLVEQTQRRIDNLKQRITDAVIRSPITGRIVTNRPLNAAQGNWVKPGEGLGMLIGDGQHFEMIVPEDQASLIERGMPVRFRLWTRPDQTIEGSISRIGTAFLSRVPHDSVSAIYGGEVDTTQTAEYKHSPASPSVLVTIDIKSGDLDAGTTAGTDTGTGNGNGSGGAAPQTGPYPGTDARLLSDGMTGRGKIVLGRSSLGEQQWRAILRGIKLDWLL